MKTMRAGWLALTLGTFLAVPVMAQGRPGARLPAQGPGLGPGQGPGVAQGVVAPRGTLADRIEAALEHRDELGLSEAQLRTLEELKVAAVQATEAARTDMEVLRGRLLDEDADMLRAREEMQALRDQIRTSHEPLRDRFLETLTVEQGRTLQSLVRPDRPGRGGGPWPGVRDGRRGPGDGPAAAPGRRGGRGGGTAIAGTGFRSGVRGTCWTGTGPGV